ncbi:type I restriction-modification system subunit M [Desulfobacula toluolica]|uniref:site-specific DNA-methyltransferase (adenine-specific) n=1 Tax=Desulfobacula toluolica (strain DSM 7467 / Tol2) TaxID=651182 RepID=K0NBW7_DESTT|nr:class I SAM-dependent DNA methyltransferase [Desulfobacula toluolica]CCK78186.1 N-6 adenine-specific DNA methylase [Desulfobacula toluolica Tol2]
MKQIVDKDKLNNLTNEIWKSAERLRGKFKAYEYQTVILPIIVIRRLECVLIQWRENQAADLKVKRPGVKDKNILELVKKLELNSKKAPFSNTTAWTLEKICAEDPTLMEKNFRAYINGFSDNVQEIIEHFNYREIIGRMVKNSRLSPILNQYAKEPLGPDELTNLEMGYVYEELLRRFSEQSGEEAGEHFTPREVIRLMVELLEIPLPQKHISVYDPACGTGGMLSVAKEYLYDRAATDMEKANVQRLVTLHGHELQPGNYAICKADMLIKEEDAKIFFGNSLIPDAQNSPEPGDQLAASKYKFDYMLSNPPFGVTWGGKDGYEHEARKFKTTRYAAGMPRTNDGAFLFLQTMLSKMKPVKNGGSKIAIIFNGSPLSNGDCGSGESEIRRWILENDWLDAIVMLPDQLFYNTGIFTYIWLLSNKKPERHKNNVMLIDGRSYYEKEPKSFGNKRNRISAHHMETIKDYFQNGWEKGFENDHVKIFNTTDFAFHKVSVVFWQTNEKDEPGFVTEPYTKALTPANITKEQTFYESDLKFSIVLTSKERETTISFTLTPEDLFSKVFEKEIKTAFKQEIKILTKALKTASEKTRAVKAFIKDLDKSVVFTHRHYVSDTEYIPFGEDIEAFLKREIEKPIIRWKDSPQLGYEILPNKYFYTYEPPQPADELLKAFWALEKEAEEMLKKL